MDCVTFSNLICSSLTSLSTICNCGSSFAILCSACLRVFCISFFSCSSLLYFSRSSLYSVWRSRKFSCSRSFSSVVRCKDVSRSVTFCRSLISSSSNCFFWSWRLWHSLVFEVSSSLEYGVIELLGDIDLLIMGIQNVNDSFDKISMHDIELTEELCRKKCLWCCSSFKVKWIKCM